MRTKTYTVHRPMQDGATEYLPGDQRHMAAADAAELVAIGALSLVDEDPVERPPAVLHTFGEAPSAVNEGGYSIADPGTAITLEKPKVAPVVADTAPQEPVAVADATTTAQKPIVAPDGAATAPQEPIMVADAAQAVQEPVVAPAAADGLQKPAKQKNNSGQI